MPPTYEYGSPLYTPPTATPFQTANGYFTQAAQNALPSPASLDRARARIRTRLSGEQAGESANVRETYAGRGRTGSGAEEASLERLRGQYLNAEGGELAQAEDDYQKQLQTGSNLLTGIGTGVANAGALQQTGQTDYNKLLMDTFLGKGALDTKQQEVDTGNRELDINKDLGEQKLGIDEKSVDETAEANFRNFLVDLMTSFGTVGNTAGDANSRNPNFDAQFSAIRNALLGEFA